MAHPFFHSISSARSFGGETKDYLYIHNFIDSTKSVIPDARHRLFLHNEIGVRLAVEIFGYEITNSDNKKVRVSHIVEKHVLEDFGSWRDAEIVNAFNTAKLPSFDMSMASVKLNSRLKMDPTEYFFDLNKFISLFRMPFEKYGSQAMTTVLANSFGIFLVEKVFGVMYHLPTKDTYKPTRFLAEKFVSGGYNGPIPSMYEIAKALPIEQWMFVNAAAIQNTNNNTVLNTHMKKLLKSAE